MPPMTTLFRLPAILMLGLLAGCASVPTPPPLTFIVVRHAEKATDDPDDPNLSATGVLRASALAGRLSAEPVVAVYATEFRRTRQTAQPTAIQHRVTISSYYAKGPAGESAARWRQAHRSGTVLIVGHSNTVPDLVGALSGRPAQPMPESEYDRFYRITFDADGRAQVEQTRY